MRNLRIAAILLAILAVAASSVSAKPGKKKKVRAELSGYQEVPAISTNGAGDFEATISKSGDAIDYTLSYDGLSAAPSMAHIHFGQPGVNGGVAAILCGGGGKPACPVSGEVSGTILAADVVGPASQGIAPTEIGELIEAIHSGATYVNVHTAAFPGGEIRGAVE